MCKYHLYTDFDGCLHRVDARHISLYTRDPVKTEYCPVFVYRWVRALLEENDNDVRRTLMQVGTGERGLDSRSPRAQKVLKEVLTACMRPREYDGRISVRASPEMSAVPASLALGPVCVNCGNGHALLQVEWDNLRQLMSLVNGNVRRGLYSDAANYPRLQQRMRGGNGGPIPAHIMALAPVEAARLRRMVVVRNTMFTQTSAVDNVFVNQQWGMARWFQRLLFYRTLYQHEDGGVLPLWTERHTAFGASVAAGAVVAAGVAAGAAAGIARTAAWQVLQNRLRDLLAVQDMSHVEPFFHVGFPVVPAYIDLTVPCPVAVRERTQAEVDGWSAPQHHRRVDYDDAVRQVQGNYNAFAFYRSAVERARYDHGFAPPGSGTSF